MRQDDVRSGPDREGADLADGQRGGGLDERDRAILDFERGWWQHAASKEQLIRERFDLSSTRYYQLLNRLIDDDDALAYDPMLVRRLRRMRAARQRQRAARRLGTNAR